MTSPRPRPGLFGKPRALIGVVHVGALPGTPRAERPVEALAEEAAQQARVYQDAGFDAAMIENMHDRPYLSRSAGPEIVAAMTRIGVAVRAASSLPLGVQVLAGANRAALAVAQSCGAAFVRCEGFVFAHVADEGTIDSDAAELLRYRRAIGAEHVRVFVDVKKKHSAHAITADVSIAETAHAAEFFLADGVVVTGPATGAETDAGEVKAVAAAVGLPVLVGSGITPDNVGRFADADGLIVGSWLKRDGLWTNPPDPARCAALRRATDAMPPR
jgi:membrane complex biogenesis BtpA family protein